MNWLVNNYEQILPLLLNHLRLSLLPIVIGFVLAIPLGWLAWRFRLTRGLLLTLASLLYTIPSIALFAVLPPLLGLPYLSETNVTIALTIYAVALMSRSAADAFGSVDADVRQSATAMGYSAWQRFWVVELPLAGPVLLAGLRVVVVSTIALVTVGLDGNLDIEAADLAVFEADGYVARLGSNVNYAGNGSARGFITGNRIATGTSSDGPFTQAGVPGASTAYHRIVKINDDMFYVLATSGPDYLTHHKTHIVRYRRASTLPPSDRIFFDGFDP